MPANIAIDSTRVTEFCQRWGVTELALFGSVLRSDFRSDSDVDVLVSFRDDVRWTLLDLVRMERELAVVLGRRVDLVERQGIERGPNYIRRANILRELEPIFAA